MIQKISLCYCYYSLFIEFWWPWLQVGEFLNYFSECLIIVNVSVLHLAQTVTQLLLIITRAVILIPDQRLSYLIPVHLFIWKEFIVFQYLCAITMQRCLTLAFDSWSVFFARLVHLNHAAGVLVQREKQGDKTRWAVPSQVESSLTKPSWKQGPGSRVLAHWIAKSSAKFSNTANQHSQLLSTFIKNLRA